MQKKPAKKKTAKKKLSNGEFADSMRQRRAGSLGPHTCHYHPCETRTKRAMLFCKLHWDMVPETIQEAVMAAYDKGKWIKTAEGKRKYFAAVNKAKGAVRKQRVRT